MTTDRRELFDRWAASYDRSLLDATGFPFEGYAAVLQRLFELADPRAGLRVLDLGTGTGALAALFAEAGCHVTGVDFSEEMLARARERVPRATFWHVDLLDAWPAALRERSVRPRGVQLRATRVRGRHQGGAADPSRARDADAWRPRPHRRRPVRRRGGARRCPPGVVGSVGRGG